MASQRRCGPGAAREWEARIDQLQSDLIKTVMELADLLPAVERAKREIAKNDRRLRLRSTL